MKIGLFFPFSFYAWMYTSIRQGITKGMFTAILRLFDVIEYLLDMHDAITKKVEKYDCEKEIMMKDKLDTDLIDCLDINLNPDKKPKLYDTDYVSFTVAAVKTQFKSDISEVVTFDQVITNEGDGYDSNNGKFSCPTSGVYVFFYSSTQSGDEDLISLVHDDHRVNASVYGSKGAGKDGEQASHMAMLHLKQNDQVWLNCTKDIVDTKNLQFATFSGFLLYEQ